MTQISRNAPCPCGSGKKYKRCCEGSRKRAFIRHWKIPSVIVALGIAGASAGYFQSGTRASILTLGVALLVALGWAAVSVAPQPSGKGKDPGSINFGR